MAIMKLKWGKREVDFIPLGETAWALRDPSLVDIDDIALYKREGGWVASYNFQDSVHGDTAQKTVDALHKQMLRLKWRVTKALALGRE
jgi:hypothetical protein